MIVETIQSLDGLRRLAPEWGRLPLPSPMQSPEWLIAWAEAYGDPTPGVSNEWCALAFRDSAGRLAGFAPLRIEHRSLIGSTLRWIGDGRASSDHHTLLVNESDRQEVVDSAAEWIIDQAGEAWRRIRLEGVDDDDPTMNALLERLERAGLDTERIADYGSFLAPLSEPGDPPDWDAYLKTLSKNRRKRLRKWRREVLDTGKARVRVAETEAEREALWPTLVELHGERRRSMGERGVFDCPLFDRFHRLASERLLAAGQLYFAVLELDGEPAAVDYALQDAHSLYAYQGGIANWALDRDAGHISQLRMVIHAIESGRTRLDLLRGDEPYKLSWGAVHRPASTIHVRPRTFTGALERWAGSTYRQFRDARQRLSSNGQA